MADRIELLKEAHRRGILPADKKPLFDEAVKRGLITLDDDSSLVGRVARGADDAVRMLAKGITLGFDDEIAAGANAIPALFDDREFSEEFEKNLAEERGRNKASENRLGPVASTGLQIGGAIAGTVTGARALGLPAVVKPGAGLIANSLRSAGAGGALAGVTGFGKAEGGFENRLREGSRMVPFGAAAGFAGPSVAKGVTAVGGAGVNALRRLMGRGVDDAAAQKVARAAVDDGFTSVGAVQREMTRLGDDAAPIDLGRSSEGLARGTRAVNSKAAGTIEDFVKGRQRSEGYRLINAVERNVSPETSAAKAISKNKADRSDAAFLAYEKIRGELVDVTPEMARVLNTLTGQKALRGAMRRLDDKLEPAGVPVQRGQNGGLRMTVELLDLAKRELGSKTRTLKRGAQDRSLDVANLERALVKAMDDQVDGYALARKAYKDPSELIEATELGRKFLSGETNVTQAAIKDMGPEEFRHFQIGAANALVSKIKSSPKTKNLAGDLLNRIDTEEKLELLFPEKAARDAFMKQLEASAQKGRVANFVTGNSESIDKGFNALSVIRQGGGITGVGVNALARMSERAAAGRNAETANALAKLMTATDVDAVAARIGPVFQNELRRRTIENRVGNALAIGGSTQAAR